MSVAIDFEALLKAELEIVGAAGSKQAAEESSSGREPSEVAAMSRATPAATTVDVRLAPCEHSWNIQVRRRIRLSFLDICHDHDDSQS